MADDEDGVRPRRKARKPAGGGTLRQATAVKQRLDNRCADCVSRPAGFKGCGMARIAVSLATTSTTIATGAVGGIAFALCGMPLAWLSGSAAAVAAAALAGHRLGIHLKLREVAIALLGLIIGSTVSPDTLSQASKWPVTLIGLVGALICMMAVSSMYLQRVHGFDRATARLSSTPGALNFVLLLSMEADADPRRVAIVQVVRLSAILMFLPSLVTLIGGEVPTPSREVVEGPVHIGQLLGLCVACGLGAAAFHRMATPAPSLIGAMLPSAVLFGTGLVDTPLPIWLLIPVFVVLGSMVGANFVGTDMRLFLEVLRAGVGSLVLSSVLALAWAAPVAAMVGLPVLQVWLAYAPGGIETSAIMALSLGLDAAFVTGHHIARVILLNATVVFWAGVRRPER